jgi:hypothetical protein
MLDSGLSHMAVRRRQSSTTPARDRASNDARGMPSVDLARRLGVLEESFADMKRTLDVHFQRMAAIQAQLDHLAAKISGR